MRPSSRAKKATVSDSGRSPASAVATSSRRRPSSARRRRRSRTGGRSAKVIADSASATASGVQASASKTSTPRGAALGLRHRAQPRPALADAAVVVAMDQVGGLEAWARRPSLARRTGHGGPAPRPHPAARDAQHDGAVAVGAVDVRHRAQRRQRPRRRVPVGVVPRRPRSRPPAAAGARAGGQARVRAAVVGDLQRVHGPAGRAPGRRPTRRRPSAAGRSARRSRWTTTPRGRWGRPWAAARRAARGGGHSTRSRARRPPSPAPRRPRRATRARGLGEQPAGIGVAPAVAVVDRAAPGRARAPVQRRPRGRPGVGDHERVQPARRRPRAGASTTRLRRPAVEEDRARHRAGQRRVALADVEERDDHLARRGAEARRGRRRAPRPAPRTAAGERRRRPRPRPARRRPRAAAARRRRRPPPERSRRARHSRRQRDRRARAAPARAARRAARRARPRPRTRAAAR